MWAANLRTAVVSGAVPVKANRSSSGRHESQRCRNITKSSFFRGLFSGQKVVSQTCGGFPPTTKVPPKDFEKPRLPPYGASSFWGPNLKAALTKRPRAFPLGQDRRGQAGLACPPSSAEQAIPGTRQHRGEVTLLPTATPLIEIDHYGRRLIGCIKCNRWGWGATDPSWRCRKAGSVSSGWSLSALPPKADICQRIEHVCFVPIADI
jgi:hypothetical protein